MGSSGWRERERSRAVGETGLSRRRHTSHRLRLAAPALLLGMGCLNVLGEVQVDDTITRIESNQTGGKMNCTDAGSAESTCVVRCTAGEMRCAGNELQECSSNGDGWRFSEQCASAALCDSVNRMCRPPRCRAGEHRCTESGELQICAPDRTDFTPAQQCTSAGHCIATPNREGCSDIPCQPGVERCNGRQIERCKADRSGYDVVGEPCASAVLCEEGAPEAGRAMCARPTCEPDTYTCDGTWLARCSGDANRYVLDTDCGSADRCLAGQGRCADGRCVAGVQRCTGNVLERCDAQGVFLAVATCADAQSCDPAALQCRDPMIPGGTLPDPSVLEGDDYDFSIATSMAVLGLGLRLSVPEQWTSIDRNPWTDAAGNVIGPRFIASSDAVRFTRNFDIPGVSFAATEAAPVDVVARLSEFDQSSRCTGAVTEAPYEDDLYAGTARTYANCGVTQARISVLVAVEKLAARFVTVVIVVMTAARDDEARDEIWNSFVAN